MPMILWRVVCAFDVMIDNFSPTNAFMSVDLPTLGFPMIFTKPDLCIFLLGYDPDKGSDKKKTPANARSINLPADTVV